MVPVKKIQQTLQTDEELLIDFVQANNQQALATLYLRYTDLVYGTCMKYLKDAELAKDAVMNIYEELLHKLPHHNVENFKSWLYVVTKNHCLMQLRNSKKQLTVSFQSGIMQSDDLLHLDDMLERESAFKLLEDCMQKLSDEQRQSIQLFYFDNKCYNEIAEQTGMKWNKIRSLIQNGRRNLKICMDTHA